MGDELISRFQAIKDAATIQADYDCWDLRKISTNFVVVKISLIAENEYTLKLVDFTNHIQTEYDVFYSYKSFWEAKLVTYQWDPVVKYDNEDVQSLS